MPSLPIQILSHPRKDDLIICWFAATMSEKSFKRRYKSAIINKINIPEVCEEIKKVIQNGRNKIRFSLHLSSQLMYGVTKLHSYQTSYFEKEVLETQQKLSDVLQKKDDVNKDVVMNLENFPFELSLREENLQLDENLHLLSHKDLDHGLQMMMENAAQIDNFGALKSWTDKELDDAFEHDINLERLRIIDFDQEREGEIHDIEITEEIHQERHSSQTSHSPLLVDVAYIKTKSKDLSLTPQKRGSQVQPQVETPTKRRRLSFEDTMAAPVAEDITVEEITAAVQRQQIEPQLQPVDSKFFVTKKSKKIIDKNIILNSQLLQKRRQDVNYNCKKSEIVQKHRSIANELLKQPSRLDHKKWADNLCDLFKNHVIGEFKSSADENIKPIGLTEITEAIRADETASKLNLPTELSTFGQDATNMADGSTFTIANIDSNNRYLNDQDVAHETLAQEILPTETAAAKEKIPETLDISEARASKESNETSQASLNHHDILAILESLWCEQECVKFNELAPDTYSAKDRTTIFQILLELHAEEKVILMQKDCYDTLWIRKYEDYYTK